MNKLIIIINTLILRYFYHLKQTEILSPEGWRQSHKLERITQILKGEVLIYKKPFIKIRLGYNLQNHILYIYNGISWLVVDMDAKTKQLEVPAGFKVPVDSALGELKMKDANQVSDGLFTVDFRTHPEQIFNKTATKMIIRVLKLKLSQTNHNEYFFKFNNYLTRF